MAPDKTFESVQQVAARFSISPATAWRWARTGRLPQPVKLSPGTTRWRSADLDAFASTATGGGR